MTVEACHQLTSCLENAAKSYTHISYLFDFHHLILYVPWVYKEKVFPLNFIFKMCIYDMTVPLCEFGLEILTVS